MWMTNRTKSDHWHRRVISRAKVIFGNLMRCITATKSDKNSNKKEFAVIDIGLPSGYTTPSTFLFLAVSLRCAIRKSKSRQKCRLLNRKSCQLTNNNIQRSHTNYNRLNQHTTKIQRVRGCETTITRNNKAVEGRRKKDAWRGDERSRSREKKTVAATNDNNFSTYILLYP